MLSHVLPPVLLAVTLLGPCSDDPAFAARSRASTAPRLGAAPPICPPGRVNNRGPLPLMGSLFTGSVANLHWGAMADVSGAFEPAYGWQHKILWTLKPSFSGTVTLTAGGVGRRALVWLEATERHVDNVPTQALPLNARWQNAFSTGAGPSFPGGIIVPEAGCYYLEARWRGGGWRGIFAAGR